MLVPTFLSRIFALSYFCQYPCAIASSRSLNNSDAANYPPSVSSIHNPNPHSSLAVHPASCAKLPPPAGTTNRKRISATRAHHHHRQLTPPRPPPNLARPRPLTTPRHRAALTHNPTHRQNDAITRPLPPPAVRPPAPVPPPKPPPPRRRHKTNTPPLPVRPPSPPQIYAPY